MSIANFPESFSQEVVRREVAYCLMTSQKTLAREVAIRKPSLEKIEAIRKEPLHVSVINPQPTSFATHLLLNDRPSVGTLDTMPLIGSRAFPL